MKIKPAEPIYVFDMSRRGHRWSYFHQMRRQFGSKTLVGSKTLLLTLKPQEVFFLTIDDYILKFFLVALVRSLMKKKTYSLSIRAEAFLRRITVARAVKQIVYRVLRWTKHVDNFTIMPFEVEPRLARYMRNWIYDLQYYDLPLLYPNIEPGKWPTPKGNRFQMWAEEIEKQRRGRKIVLSVGRQTWEKGINYFLQLGSDAQISEKFLFVGIGPFESGDRAQKDLFIQNGGYWQDLFVSEVEMLQLYLKADLVWSCYHPEYDQSSGIYGRALQLGRVSLIRKGSYLEKFSELNRVSSHTITWGDVGAARDELSRALQVSPQTPYSSAVVKSGPERLKEVFNSQS